MADSVLISIINWNSYSDTIKCIGSVLSLNCSSEIAIQLLVIDNASDDADAEMLEKWLRSNDIPLIRNSENLGFAGGHNYAIKKAIDSECTYVWLLNNDAIVYQDTLDELIKLMAGNHECGSCSPVIRRLNQPEIVDFCGASHSWLNLSTIHPKSFDAAPDFCKLNADNIWLAGTAILFRVEAIKQTGLLDEKLFAYYEDNDIGVRLINKGWTNLLAFDSSVEHACFDGIITERKPYYFYLMARNSFLFYVDHTPKPFRKLLQARLMVYSLDVAEGLYRLGYSDKANACLLGVADGLMKKGGPPALNRSVPFWLQCLRPIGR